MSTHTVETNIARHRINVVNRNMEYLCRDDKTLLVGMELENARAIEVGCRGGGCGMCKIRILEGDYESKRMSRAHVSEEEQAQGYALACRVIPRGDMVIESDHFVAAQ